MNNIGMKLGFLNTIRFKLVMGLLFFLMPCLLLVTYTTFYASNYVIDQVAASNKNIVSLYLKQIDNNLNDMDRYLADLAGANPDFSIMSYNFNETQYILAEVRLNDYILYKERHIDI